MSVSMRLMAARDAVEEFTQLSDDGGLIDELLDAYAHELAEKLRMPLDQAEAMLIQAHMPLHEVLARRLDPESGEE